MKNERLSSRRGRRLFSAAAVFCPSASLPAGIFLTLLLLSVPLLSGCLEGEARIFLNGGGSGRIELAYTIPRALAGVGRVGEDRLLVPLPVRETDFADAEARYGGISFRNTDVQESPGEIQTQTVLLFDSPNALADFWLSSAASWQFSRQPGELRILLYQPFERGVSPVLLERFRALGEPRQWDLQVQVPGRVESVSPGEAVGGDRAAVVVDVQDVLEENEELWWEISWR